MDNKPLTLDELRRTAATAPQQHMMAAIDAVAQSTGDDRAMIVAALGGAVVTLCAATPSGARMLELLDQHREQSLAELDPGGN